MKFSIKNFFSNCDQICYWRNPSRKSSFFVLFMKVWKRWTSCNADIMQLPNPMGWSSQGENQPGEFFLSISRQHSRMCIRICIFMELQYSVTFVGWLYLRLFCYFRFWRDKIWKKKYYCKRSSNICPTSVFTKRKLYLWIAFRLGTQICY